MKKTLCFVVLLAFASCKTIPPASTSSIKSDSSQVLFKEKLASEQDVLALASPDPHGLSFVKFTYLYGVPPTDKDSDKLFFQNTQEYPVHQAFLKANVDRYKNYPDEAFGGLILASLDPDEKGSVKEITAGTLLYKPATATTPASIGYEIDFNQSPDDAEKTLVDTGEVSRFDQKLKLALSFVKPENVFYLLSKPNDPQAYKFPLKKLGVNTVIEGAFIPPVAKVSTTYSPASSYGYLRTLSLQDFNEGKYTDRDIVILKSIPLDIGPVAGIISEAAQVAHSHVIFRAVNQKIPDMYIPSAETVFQAHKDELVKFTALADNTYQLQTEADNPQLAQEAQAFWQSRRPSIVVPEANLSTTELRVWTQKPADKSLVTSYGAKGTNFAIIDAALTNAKVDRSLYQSSFMIPFSYYAKFLQTPVTAKACQTAAKKCNKDLTEEGLTGDCSAPTTLCSTIVSGKSTLQDFADAMVGGSNKEKMYNDPITRKAHLAFFSRLMRETELPSTILDPIRTKLKAYPETRRMRLRSSTNAEDLAGLNGAGLYESKAACLGDGDNNDDKDGKPSVCRTTIEINRMQKMVADLRAMKDEDGSIKKIADEVESDINKKYPLKNTIRSVYASLWTERAYLNREYYGIDHKKIFMGMLAHPAFINETVNGVAVVQFQQDQSIEVKVVSQVQDVSITNPVVPGALPEELSLVRDPSGVTKLLKVVSRSTLIPSGERVVNDGNAQELARQLIIAASALKSVHGGDRFDLEFMFDENQKVLIKQGRPL